ncbi:hypothetical protein IFM89_036472 [Coptis chinensis]|uniref:F-box domain-containing protein n=1 Tax=Coptis chinensis TaxID=261450 RepID=A0A835IYU6_9MAGN|nr:hypothetical protein IFM89_036472 [Coptis chinensis]
MRPSVRLRPVGWVERQRSAFPPSISHKGNSDRLVMTTVSEEDEDETLAHFLESEILSSDYPDDNHKEHTKTTATDSSPPLKKKLRLNDDKDKGVGDGASSSNNIAVSESGKIFSMIPPEVFHHILKFLSSEDLIACSLVCKFLNLVASDECLWHRLASTRQGEALSEDEM